MAGRGKHSVSAGPNSEPSSPPGDEEWGFPEATPALLDPALPSSQLDLVCTHKTLPPLSQSIFMAGMLIASLMFGTLADRLLLDLEQRAL